jgi:pyruvate dehydrogenase E2 component (dihydrolipoamide acetyltransferase)
MSRFVFKLPDVGEGVAEAEIVEWKIKVGDRVEEDQPLVDVMTDKASVTITSPKAGRIASLHGKAGEVVKVHSVLVSFDLSGGAAEAPVPAAEPKKDQGPAATAVGDIKESLPGMGTMTATATPSALAATAATGAAAAKAAAEQPTRATAVPASDEYAAPHGRALATPATRKLARDLSVDLTRVRPTGPQGRVTKDDLRAYANRGSTTALAPTAVEAPAPTPEVRAPSPASGAQATVTPSGAPAAMTTRAPVSIATPSAKGGELLEERVPFAGLRRKIAEKMSQSVHTAAHFTFVEECDVTALKAVRERLRPKAEALGVKLTPLAFIAKAAVLALKKFPVLNAAIDESTNELVYRKYYNLGIAASSEAGLVVPVVKGADKRSLLDVAREIERLGGDVKSGKMKLEDLQGSTFTITSLGAQGGLFATPIINFPEVAILGVHQIKQKPVVRDGQIVIGEVMLLSLSFDHRVVDGHVGAAFAYEIIRYLHDPDALLLES